MFQFWKCSPECRFGFYLLLRRLDFGGPRSLWSNSGCCKLAWDVVARRQPRAREVGQWRGFGATGCVAVKGMARERAVLNVVVGRGIAYAQGRRIGIRGSTGNRD